MTPEEKSANREKRIAEMRSNNQGIKISLVTNETESIFDAYFDLHKNDPAALKKVFLAYKEFKDRESEDLANDFIQFIALAKKWRNRGGGKKIEEEQLREDQEQIKKFIDNLGRNEKPSWETFIKKLGLTKEPPFGRTKFYELIKTIKEDLNDSVRESE